MNNRSVRISSFPRIHFGLIDMGGATRRAYGGCGLSLNAFGTSVSVGSSDVLSIKINCHVESRTHEDISRLLLRLKDRFPGVTGLVQVDKVVPEHVGLGSKTTLLLSIIKALDEANGLGLSKDALIALSARGGASGVGTGVFFLGGFVVDAGHPQVASFPLHPSSFRIPLSPALLTLHLDFPLAWRISLLLPRSYGVSAGRDEIEFFAKNTPVPSREVLDSMAAVYHGVVPGIVSSDLNLLAVGLSDLSKVGFKKREIAQQGGSASLIEFFQDRTGFPIGMSSMGPLVYVISGSESYELERIRVLAEEAGANCLGHYQARNHGYLVEIHE